MEKELLLLGHPCQSKRVRHNSDLLALWQLIHFFPPPASISGWGCVLERSTRGSDVAPKALPSYL